MDNDTSCFNGQRFMMKYMDGTITNEENALLLEHILTCSACAEDYALYENILSGFADAPLLEAPPGFECAVMAKIALLPCVYGEDENRIDTLMCVVWGSFSVLSGAGMLLFINKDGLMQWALSDPRLATYVEAVTPLSEAYYATLAQFAQFFEIGLKTFGAYASSIQLALVGIFSVLALAQFFIYRKDKAKVKV